MAAFVVLTVHLRQKGSPESKPLQGKQPVDAEPSPRKLNAPWPVPRGGIVLKLYENSLGLALFAYSFCHSPCTRWVGPPTTTTNRPSTEAPPR